MLIAIAVVVVMAAAQMYLVSQIKPPLPLPAGLIAFTWYYLALLHILQLVVR